MLPVLPTKETTMSKTITKEEAITMFRELGLAIAMSDVERNNHPVHEHVKAAQKNVAEKAAVVSSALLNLAGIKGAEAFTVVFDTIDYVTDEIARLKNDPVEL